MTKDVNGEAVHSSRHMLANAYEKYNRFDTCCVDKGDFVGRMKLSFLELQVNKAESEGGEFACLFGEENPPYYYIVG